MRKLSTYFALFSALIAVLMGSVVLFVASTRGVVDVLSFFLLVPIGALFFLFALLVGHFLAEPIEELIRKIRAYRAGSQTVDFSPAGSLEEADELALAFQDLLDSYYAQNADLSRREKQQLQFVGDVAHELRTPLTAIHGTAELLADADLPPDMRARFSHTIVNESERLSRLVNDLLSLQRLQNRNGGRDFEPLDLRPIVQEAVDALAPVLEERQANVQITGEAPNVLGRRDSLKQVVSNLVDNASRFVQPGGHIRVELYGVHANSVIAVKDDGCGFGNVDPQMLFERFFRADQSRARATGGSGLGLSIVKSVVEAHDGTVEAYNLPEGGACFIVAIPSLAPTS